MNAREHRQPNIADLALLILIAGVLWAMFRTHAKPSLVWSALSVPLCVTLGLAGIAGHSLIVRRSLAIHPINRLAYILAWTACASRYLILTSAFGTLPPEGTANMVIALNGTAAAVIGAVAACVGGVYTIRQKRAQAGAAVLAFGLFPLVPLIMDLLEFINP